MNGHPSLKRDGTKTGSQATEPTTGFDRLSRSPTVAIRETSEAILIDVELPGVKAEHLQLSANQGVLTLDAHVSTPDRDGAEILHREYDDFAFHRTFTLPDQVDAQAISAQAKHGVVVITLPKSKATQPRRIPVAVD